MNEQEEKELLMFKEDFVDYMKGILIKGGVSTMN